MLCSLIYSALLHKYTLLCTKSPFLLLTLKQTYSTQTEFTCSNSNICSMLYSLRRTNTVDVRNLMQDLTEKGIYAFNINTLQKMSVITQTIKNSRNGLSEIQ